jgi:hypothetical protein
VLSNLFGMPVVVYESNSLFLLVDDNRFVITNAKAKVEKMLIETLLLGDHQWLLASCACS